MLSKVNNIPEESRLHGLSLYTLIREGHYKFRYSAEWRVISWIGHVFIRPSLPFLLLLGFAGLNILLYLIGTNLLVILLGIPGLLIIFRGMFLIRKESRSGWEHKQLLLEIDKIKEEEDKIENLYQEIQEEVIRDSSSPDINIGQLDILSSKIASIEPEVKNLENLYKIFVKHVRRRSWILHNTDNLENAIEQYQDSKNKNIIHINNQFILLIKSWIDIHSHELGELNNELKTKINEIENNKEIGALELQTLRIEQYINSIQSITNN